MKKHNKNGKVLLVIILLHKILLAQSVGINTTGANPNNFAVLDVVSLDQGVLVPRCTDAQRQTIKDPALGLIIYNTTSNTLNFYNGSGWYQIDGGAVSTTTGSGSGPGNGVSINASGDIAQSSAILDISSSDKGLLIPRTTQGSVSLVAGLIIFNTSTNTLNYYDGSSWQEPCPVLLDNSKGAGATGAGVSINENGSFPDPSAILDINSSNKGILIPRMNSSQRDNIKSPAQGLILYNTSSNTIEYWTGSSWNQLISSIPTQPTSITGTNNACKGQTGVSYSVTNVSGVSYNWTYSGTGVTIASGQGTNAITADFSGTATNGTLTVTPSNACGTGTAQTLSTTTTAYDWLQTPNPSAQAEYVYDIEADATGVYAVGQDFSPGAVNPQWRYEKWDLNGVSQWVQTINPTSNFDLPYGGTAIDVTGLYAVGGSQPSVTNDQWYMQKRNLTTGAVIWTQTSNPTGASDYCLGVDVDGSGVYVAGIEQSLPGSKHKWRIEKRSLTTGALITAFDGDGIISINFSADGEQPSGGVATDGTGVFVAGYDQSISTSDHQWRIIKFNATTGAQIWNITRNLSGSADQPTSIAVDATGVYVGGRTYGSGAQDWTIEKYNLATGALIWSQVLTNVGAPEDMVSDGSTLYISGSDVYNGGGQFLMEKRNTSTGAILCSVSHNPSAFNDRAYGIAQNGSGVFVGGSDRSLGGGDFRWHVFKQCACP